MRAEAAIIIPHFQTPVLSRWCLELLRERTWPARYEAVVIDNGSRDGSGEELRQLGWVRVIRREPESNEHPTLAHGRALNLGVAMTRAPFVVTLHTDSMILREDWLNMLLDRLEAGGKQLAGVGASKAPLPWWQRPGKSMEDRLRLLLGQAVSKPEYLRSHFAIYRRSALSVHPNLFEPSDGKSAGEELHHTLLSEGYSTDILPPGEAEKYVHHLNHATLALNEELGVGHRYVPRTRNRAMKRIERFLSQAKATRVAMSQLR